MKAKREKKGERRREGGKRERQMKAKREKKGERREGGREVGRDR